MAPLGVIEHLDVVEDIGSGVITAWLDQTTDAFTFEQLEETLSYGVVVTVAAAAHAVSRFQEHTVTTARRLSWLRRVPRSA